MKRINVDIPKDMELWWNLDTTFAAVMGPLIRKLRANLHGHPCNMTFKEWEAILDKIADGLDYMASDQYWEFENHEEREKRIEETLDLFRKHIRGMWD